MEEQIVNGGTEDAQQTQLSVRQGTLQLFSGENCISSLCMFYMASFTTIVLHLYFLEQVNQPFSRDISFLNHNVVLHMRN